MRLMELSGNICPVVLLAKVDEDLINLTDCKVAERIA